MRKRRKIRMLREKKKQLSRFLPLPFRASYPFGGYALCPFALPTPSPRLLTCTLRASSALPTP